MWSQKSREIRRLRARKEALADHLEDARNALKSERGARSIIARNFSVAHEALRRYSTRLNRALRGCARYRAELAAAQRLIRDQQRQLDDLLGLNDIGIEMGLTWQERRADKRPTYRPTADATPPTVNVATPEPGEVTTP